MYYNKSLRSAREKVPAPTPAHYVVFLVVMTLFRGLFLPPTDRRLLVHPERVDHWTPSVASFEVVGIVTDPNFNRDSCASVRLSQTRALWTCRDTDVFLPSHEKIGFVSNTASWIDLDVCNHNVAIVDGELTLRGHSDYHSVHAYFPLQGDSCNHTDAGKCSDGTRYAIWPESTPMAVALAGKGFPVSKAYTWIRKLRIRERDFTELNTDSIATTLYSIEYQPQKGPDDGLPPVTVLDNFWHAGEIPYGSYGSLVYEDPEESRTWAYVFAKMRGVASPVVLGRVKPLQVENRDAYQYWHHGIGKWMDEAPDKNDDAAGIPNISAGGQGTYYYSPTWQRFVWIGQAGVSVSAEFFITTSRTIEGGWASPQKFLTAESGTHLFGAYTLQAHPGLIKGAWEGNGGEDGKVMYLSYTKADNITLDGQDFTMYTTPLIRVVWTP